MSRTLKWICVFFDDELDLLEEQGKVLRLWGSWSKKIPNLIKIEFFYFPKQYKEFIEERMASAYSFNFKSGLLTGQIFNQYGDFSKRFSVSSFSDSMNHVDNLRRAVKESEIMETAWK